GATLGLARRLLLAELGPPPLLAGLLVVLVGAEFLLHSAPLDQLLEQPESLTDRFLVVNPHAQTHSSSLHSPPPRPGNGFRAGEGHGEKKNHTPPRSGGKS